MNFLELCQAVATRSGGVARAPSTVVGQSGRQLEIVDWTSEAWRQIQSGRSDWRFMKAEWEGDLVAHTATYTGLSFNAERFGRFLGDQPGYRPTTLYETALGVADESEIRQIGWTDYRLRYGRGAQIEQRPTEYCIDNSGAIRFGCTPDKAYTARGEYMKRPQVLELDEDEPDLPVEFHDAIVARAILLMAEKDEAGPAIQIWMPRDKEWRFNMLRAFTDPVDPRAGGPLA